MGCLTRARVANEDKALSTGHTDYRKFNVRCIADPTVGACDMRDEGRKTRLGDDSQKAKFPISESKGDKRGESQNPIGGRLPESSVPNLRHKQPQAEGESRKPTSGVVDISYPSMKILT